MGSHQVSSKIYSRFSFLSDGGKAAHWGGGGGGVSVSIERELYLTIFQIILHVI